MNQPLLTAPHWACWPLTIDAPTKWCHYRRHWLLLLLHVGYAVGCLLLGNRLLQHASMRKTNRFFFAPCYTLITDWSTTRSILRIQPTLDTLLIELPTKGHSMPQLALTDSDLLAFRAQRYPWQCPRRESIRYFQGSTSYPISQLVALSLGARARRNGAFDDQCYGN